MHAPKQPKAPPPSGPSMLLVLLLRLDDFPFVFLSEPSSFPKFYELFVFKLLFIIAGYPN